MLPVPPFRYIQTINDGYANPPVAFGTFCVIHH